MDIWAECNGQDSIVPIAGGLIRVVESQEQVATNALVDDLDEQALLEDMLEESKPPPHPEGHGLHYLLTTPFRYPPLRHGSRFGRKHESSLFYGAQELPVVLAEAAYYRFVFWSGMVEPPPAGKLTTEHTVFGVSYEAQMGIQLHAPPFDRFAAELTHPEDYVATQQLGSQMRESDIQAFEYRSARDPGTGLNVALYTPSAFASKGLEWQQPWICETRAEMVAYYNKESGSSSFGLEQFLVSGQLPIPAV